MYHDQVIWRWWGATCRANSPLAFTEYVAIQHLQRGAAAQNVGAIVKPCEMVREPFSDNIDTIRTPAGIVRQHGHLLHTCRVCHTTWIPFAHLKWSSDNMDTFCTSAAIVKQHGHLLHIYSDHQTTWTPSAHMQWSSDNMDTFCTPAVIHESICLFNHSHIINQWITQFSNSPKVEKLRITNRINHSDTVSLHTSK